MAGDKRKSHSREGEDFIFTISDTEEGLPDLDEDDDIALGSQNSSDEQESKSILKSKKSKAKSSRKVKKRESELDPSFLFETDNFLDAGTNDGWDFDVAGSKDHAKSQVDLDRILRSKGGLRVQEESEASDSNSERESEKNGNNSQHVSDEDKSSESLSENSESDEEEHEIDATGLKGPYRLPESDESDVSDDNDDKSSGEEEFSANNSDESSDEEIIRHPMDELSDNERVNGMKDEAEEEDSAEAVAQFYSNEKVDQGSSVHKTFQTLSLSRPILRALGDLGYTSPTSIQSATIPMVLLGKDVVAGAMTGSGKTAAYMIPILERLLYRPKRVASTRVVVLTPTRELSIQVADVGKKIGKYVNGIRFGLAVGGLNLRIQEQELKSRPDFVIATPGRFIDHIRNSPSFQVDDVEILVIDEADRMLEEGFQKELTEILQLIPSKRQTLLFSATMNARIKSLIQLSLHKPVRIMIDAPKTAAEGLTQEFVRIRKRESSRPALLVWFLRKLDSNERTMVFVAHKQTAHRLRIIAGLLGLKVGELHGSLTQDQRLQSVSDFKRNTVPILICTDLASRGLDIPRVEVVINYEMPKSYDIYIHRVGRTARAGREGRSISFVGEASSERAIVRDAIRNIEKNGSGRAVSRNVDWNAVESISETINSKEEVINEVLTEEKEQKLLAKAEMEVKKGENQLKYHDEILSRPRRTWFESEAEKQKNKGQKSKPGQANNTSKKRKSDGQENNKRLYKKTKNDRLSNSKPKNKGSKGRKQGK